MIFYQLVKHKDTREYLQLYIYLLSMRNTIHTLRVREKIRKPLLVYEAMTKQSTAYYKSEYETTPTYVVHKTATCKT